MINQSARYFIPDPSTWPITGSIALLCLASGAASWFNGWSPGKPGPPLFISLREGEFVVLPPGVRFLHHLRAASG